MYTPYRNINFKNLGAIYEQQSKKTLSFEKGNFV